MSVIVVGDGGEFGGNVVRGAAVGVGGLPSPISMVASRDRPRMISWRMEVSIPFKVKPSRSAVMLPNFEVCFLCSR